MFVLHECLNIETKLILNNVNLKVALYTQVFLLIQMITHIHIVFRICTVIVLVLFI